MSCAASRLLHPRDDDNEALEEDDCAADGRASEKEWKRRSTPSRIWLELTRMR
jgi:hypothetical protein